MRLHNRQIKASFWTDTELIRELPLEGRLFYLGLIQLADDSGCLEDDLLAFKIMLFPGDASITEDVLSEYRKTLVRLGKLIPYFADGKDCLYLKNFHKHQTLRTPSAPEVPLPPWIQWEPYPSNDRAGKYIVDTPTDAEKAAVEPVSDGMLTCKKSVRTSSDDPGLQSSSNLEPELEPELEPKTDRHSDTDSLCEREDVPATAEPNRMVSPSVGPLPDDDFRLVRDAYSEHIGLMGPGEYKVLTSWLEDPEVNLPADVIAKAIEEAGKQGKRRIRYVEGILRNWYNDGVKTVADIETKEQARRIRAGPDRSVDIGTYETTKEEWGWEVS